MTHPVAFAKKKKADRILLSDSPILNSRSANVPNFPLSLPDVTSGGKCQWHKSAQDYCVSLCAVPSFPSPRSFCALSASPHTFLPSPLKCQMQPLSVAQRGLPGGKRMPFSPGGTNRVLFSLVPRILRRFLFVRLPAIKRRVFFSPGCVNDGGVRQWEGAGRFPPRKL